MAHRDGILEATAIYVAPVLSSSDLARQYSKCYHLRPKKLFWTEN